MAGGIFCIENWSADLRSQDTVGPLLDFLASHGDARVIRQRVSTTGELRLYMRRFSDLKSYQIAYLALHGARGKVCVGNMSLEIEHLVSASGGDDAVIDLTGKILYLGSCASLSVSRERLQRLRERTGAAAICGYTKYAEWHEAAAVEVMLLAALADAVNGSRATVPATIKRLRRRGGTLMDCVGFVCEPDWRPAVRPARVAVGDP